jgi:hypothetical protein
LLLAFWLQSFLLILVPFSFQTLPTLGLLGDQGRRISGQGKSGQRKNMAAAEVADFKETKLSDKAISSKKSDDVQDQVKDQEGIEKILETFIFILGLYCNSRDKPIIHIDSYHIED